MKILIFLVGYTFINNPVAEAAWNISTQTEGETISIELCFPVPRNIENEKTIWQVGNIKYNLEMGVAHFASQISILGDELNGVTSFRRLNFIERLSVNDASTNWSAWHSIEEIDKDRVHDLAEIISERLRAETLKIFRLKRLGPFGGPESHHLFLLKNNEAVYKQGKSILFYSDQEACKAVKL